MKTFTNYAAKAKQFLNLLQGYTKGIRMTVILVLLLMGVSNAWAADVQKDAIIYFDNSASQWSYAYHYFAINESYGYKMTKVNNTLLYVHKRTDNTWGGYSSIRLFATTSSWGDPTASDLKGYDNMKSHGANITNTYTNYGFNANNYYYIKPDQKGSTSSHANISVGHLGSSYSSLNNTITIKAKVSTNGGSSYSEANTPAKLTGSSKVFTAYNSCAGTSDASATLNAGSSSTTFKAGYTANTTLTAVAATGYAFVGWYSGDTKISDQLSITVNPTGATTYYAHYKANQYTITYKDQNNANFSGSHASGHPTKHTYGTATALKTASKTGYTFGGWFTNSGCTGTAITSLGATAYTANITLYAKWTEKPKYTVTISSDGNGTVSPNTPQQVGEIPVPITATPNDGYKFKNWTKTGNVTIANANNASTTIKATGTGTVTANFETANRIYLKPAGDNSWANGSPRYAVYVIDDLSWHDMTKINNDIYYCDINPTYQKVIFCRMNPGNSANDWGNRWTQTEDLTLPDNCNMFDIAKDASTEDHDKASGTWMEYNAWHLAGAFNAWALCGQTFEKQGDGSFTFTQHLEAGNTYEFKLVHNGEWYGNNGTMVRGTSTGWIMSTSEGNCKITADYTGDYTFTFDASTKKLTVRYPILITLVRSEFGHYGIKYNGKSYLSHKDKDVDINVPYGATITFIEGQPYSDIYTGGIMQSAPEVDKKRQVELNQPFTVLNDVTFDDNYVTNVSQTIYLGVPNSSTWNNSGQANLIWRYDSQGSFMMYDDLDMGKEVFEANGVKYYEFTLQPGCNKFQFQRKDKSTHQDLHNASETYAQTLFHIYEVLNTDVNCYMLDGGMDGNKHTGYWCELPPAKDDYRLLYIEQKVEKKDWKTVITRTKAHPSNIIRKGTGRQIVSLYINAEGNHPEVILQQYDGTNWINQERHMVLGPLTADAGMAMLPGRRNAANENILIYDDGIEVIKDDVNNHKYKGSGVWNFTVVQDGSSAHLDLTANGLKRYEGEYYIRCDAAFGQWNGYKCSDNHMTRSNVSMQNSNYSHYYCKWIKDAGTNVKFTVANDYGHSISDTLTADMTDMWGTAIADNQKMVTGETLPASANVRFTWNEKTNLLHRAYIAGSNDVENFLTVHYASQSKKFNDQGEWIYAIDLTDVQVDDKLTSIKALYDSKEQELLEQKHVNAGGLVMLTSTGVARTGHHIRVVYDFKINQTLIYLIPTGADVSTSIDMIIERINQDEEGEAIQVRSTITPDPTEGLTVYGVITLTKDHITDPTKSEQEALTYWISFPFDVNIADISGFGEHGKDWILRQYNGKKRAEIGWFLDTKTFWERISEGTLEANTGYVLALHTRMLNESCPLYENTSTLKLYFPSNKKITDPINTGLTQTTCTIPTHTCTITQPLNRTTEDSNWNLIGVPSFADQNKTTNDNITYFYDYDFANDKYNTEKNTGNKTFKPMHAYMVQFGGVIDWSTFSFTENGGQQLAARKNTSLESHTLRLELQQNGVKADQTFVELQDDATTMFDMNIDLTKMFNAGANIYTIIGDNKTEAAANVLPIANTVIPVGVQIAKAGEYTFAMPDGTDGIVVELIDYETNTTTNLMLDEYTVNLAAGTNESRFALSVKPDKTTTSLEDININSNGVKKYLIDGVLYLQKDGVLYDAQGKLVR